MIEDIVTIYMWEKPIEILEIKKENPLAKVKVAILYERIGGGKIINRGVEDEIEIFKETKADFIFRAFWRWKPCPENCEDLDSPEQRQECKLKGYSYEHLEETISKIKKEVPDIIICGAIPAQIIHRKAVWNPKTGEIITYITYPKTWELALDSSKWLGFPTLRRWVEEGKVRAIADGWWKIQNS